MKLSNNQSKILLNSNIGTPLSHMLANDSSNEFNEVSVSCKTSRTIVVYTPFATLQPHEATWIATYSRLTRIADFYSELIVNF